MLRRGSDTDANRRRRAPGGTEVDPFHPDAPMPVEQERTTPFDEWTTSASYLNLDPRLVSELVRAAMGSAGVAGHEGGELAVGAMLASLAVRGEDVLLEELLAVSAAELRLNRYAVGQLTPLAVHPVETVAELLRALAWCASSGSRETWEAVASDGRHDPIAVASARRHELRWLQPPAPDDPHNVSWLDPTTPDLPPGSTAAWWAAELGRPATPRPTTTTLPPLTTPVEEPPIGPAVARAMAATGGPRSTGNVDTDALLAAVRETVDHSLASAFIELELEPGTLAELRDTSVLERLVETVIRLEQRLQQVEATNRQVQELTSGVEELTEAARSLMRHQWDHMPPQNFWVRIQRADDELRRSIDDLTSEVRTRLPKPGREPRTTRARAPRDAG